MDYPVMLYKFPGSVQLQDGKYDTAVAADEDEAVELLDAGWQPSPEAARSADALRKSKAATAAAAAAHEKRVADARELLAGIDGAPPPARPQKTAKATP